MTKSLIAPSFIAGDYACIREEIAWLNQSAADRLHLDVADGHFVPNILLGFPVLAAICRLATLPLDFHLMLANPAPYIPRYADLGAASITVHLEVGNTQKLLDLIRQQNCQTGLAINPATPVKALEPFIDQIDTILVMSVEPGYAGQHFLPMALEKIQQTQTLLRSNSSLATITADGGVGLKNAQQVVAAGASTLVLGKYIFDATDKDEAIHAIRSHLLALE